MVKIIQALKRQTGKRYGITSEMLPPPAPASFAEGTTVNIISRTPSVHMQVALLSCVSKEMGIILYMTFYKIFRLQGVDKSQGQSRRRSSSSLGREWMRQVPGAQGDPQTRQATVGARGDKTHMNTQAVHMPRALAPGGNLCPVVSADRDW